MPLRQRRCRCAVAAPLPLRRCVWRADVAPGVDYRNIQVPDPGSCGAGCGEGFDGVSCQGVAGKLGLQANQAHPGVAGKSGLQANQTHTAPPPCTPVDSSREYVGQERALAQATSRRPGSFFPARGGWGSQYNNICLFQDTELSYWFFIYKIKILAPKKILNRNILLVFYI